MSEGWHSRALTAQLQEKWRTFLSLVVCGEAGLEQSWLAFVEEHSEV